MNDGILSDGFPHSAFSVQRSSFIDPFVSFHLSPLAMASVPSGSLCVTALASARALFDFLARLMV